MIESFYIRINAQTMPISRTSRICPENERARASMRSCGITSTVVYSDWYDRPCYPPARFFADERIGNTLCGIPIWRDSLTVVQEKDLFDIATAIGGQAKMSRPSWGYGFIAIMLPDEPSSWRRWEGDVPASLQAITRYIQPVPGVNYFGTHDDPRQPGGVIYQ